MELTTKDKQRLKAEAHQLKPVIMIGNNGLTEAVMIETLRALHDHELIKIKIAGDDRDLRKQMTAEICEQADAELVQAIGHVIVIFKKNISKG